MELMNDPERKAEAEQFLRSRVQPQASDQAQQEMSNTVGKTPKT